MRAGGVIAYPTETVFGLGCDPLDMHAIERILELKQRPQEKGLILIGGTLEHLLPFIDVDDAKLQNKLASQSARPTTWICPISTATPQWLSGKHHSIAVRISPSPLVQQLCNAFGSAIVSTSANPSGKTPAANALVIQRYFQQRLNYVLHGNGKLKGKPSRIIDLLSGRVIRD